eukprot:3473157-Alexandrium_andersonii.AAC.1
MDRQAHRQGVRLLLRPGSNSQGQVVAQDSALALEWQILPRDVRGEECFHPDRGLVPQDAVPDGPLLLPWCSTQGSGSGCHQGALPGAQRLR